MITGRQFFEKWVEVADLQRESLLTAWESSPDYTAQILRNSPPGSLVVELARKLELEVYCDYYCLDAVFFCASDRVHCSPVGQTWVQNVRVAFEHENDFRSGLFQETSHLLITRAELRVLVTYPEGYSEEAELCRLNKIIEAAGAAPGSFLLITGKRVAGLDGWSHVEWTGRINDRGWQPV